MYSKNSFILILKTKVLPNAMKRNINDLHYNILYRTIKYPKHTLNNVIKQMQNFTPQKILAGIKYFSTKTQNVGRTKLFKLLYFWDFMHFKKYGFSITGYKYYTFPFGPVPMELWEQIENDSLPEVFKKEFKIVPDESIDEDQDGYKKFKIILRNKKIDFDWLSPNEKEILEQVAFIFQYSTAKEMTEISHLKNSPWYKTKKEFGMNKYIDYRLAIDDESTLDQETIEEYLELQRELYFNGRFWKGANVHWFSSNQPTRNKT